MSTFQAFRSYENTEPNVMTSLLYHDDVRLNNRLHEFWQFESKITEHLSYDSIGTLQR